MLCWIFKRVCVEDFVVNIMLKSSLFYRNTFTFGRCFYSKLRTEVAKIVRTPDRSENIDLFASKT